MDPMVITVLAAAEQGHRQRLGSLLKENPAMAEACDEEGSTPLMYAAANGRENVLYLLVQVRPRERAVSVESLASRILN